jgi:hypothetical protein
MGEKTQKNASFFCEKCEYTTNNKYDYKRHLLTLKHEKTQKNANIIATHYCEYCNYIASNDYDYEKHCSTLKHEKSQKNAETASKNPKTYTCDKCEYITNHKPGYMRHLNTLKHKKMVSGSITDKIITATLQENRELLIQNKQLVETLINLKQTPTINNNTNNNHVSINIFLNENCKDAINMSEFVKNLEVTFDDLEKTGEHGFIEGISGIFIRGLKQLDAHKRPIHCSDVKRETLYVKDKDVWEKEGESRENLRKVIDKIAFKNTTQLIPWIEEHPNCQDPDSKENDQFLQIAMKSAGADDENKDYKQIVKKVSKEVPIPEH